VQFANESLLSKLSPTSVIVSGKVFYHAVLPEGDTWSSNSSKKTTQDCWQRNISFQRII